MQSMEHLTRQLDLIPTRVLETPITCIGAGAIGGWVVLAAAKMGFSEITVFDDDLVSVENMNSQFYRFKDIGSSKVFALQALVHDFTGLTIDARNEKYVRGAFTGLVISAVDSMAVRRTIWENHAKTALRTKAVIDPRMGAETAALYVMNPMDPLDCEVYPASLFSDEQAIQERCTAKATIYTANMLAGLVCKAMKDVLTTQNYLRTANWDIGANAFHGWRKDIKHGRSNLHTR
jgi:molybdopterin/thiamine biosynthesis adenylyltransferase